MSNALVTAEIGMVNGIERLNVISHNLANTSATGYKKDISFNQVASQIQASRPGLNTQWQGIADSGSYYLPTVYKALDLQPGKLRQTDNKLDVAVKGPGFLEVTTPGGNRYTRAGSLSLDASGTLVTSSGYPVSGLSGDIRISTTTPRIDKDGTIWDGEDNIGQLKVIQFRDTSLLEKQGDGLFISESPKNIAKEYEEYEIYQGYVEASNVNMMKEMVDLIETMRQIESTQKVISAYDEMMSTSLSTITEL